ncbi:MAG: 23S rRNA (uracil(1939)-C(5))-methyltransferase RlmD [Cyanobacteriota bacterium]|nr:23S rRNA (uracil(1939)-C(5))-methyltransferase RlmD [Cyanobacteriota bacterium]
MPPPGEQSAERSPHQDLQPGLLLELTATGLSHDGRGVIPLPEGVVFVPGALPGERVLLRLVHRSRRLWQGELVEVLEPSSDRCRPPCILADRCGGCTAQHLALQAQQQWKRQKVVDALQRIAHLTQAEQQVAPLVGHGDGYGYRNRAMLPLERREDGSLRAGYYRPGTHRIVNLNHCPVLDPRLDSLVAPLKTDLEASGWPVDRHLTGGGGLRHLGLRLGHHSGEVLFTLVSSRPDLEGLEDQAARWMERWPHVVGVCLNLQEKANNVIFGPHTQALAGRPWLREHFAGLELTIGADTFFQVNTPLAEAVVPLILEGLEGIQPGRLIDAYCGIGTYSLPLAAAGWQVEGIEVGAPSVELARRNALTNGLETSCRFQEGSVSAWLGELLGDCDALLLDPPRKGLEAEVLAAIEEQPPERLLYLSCDPATLARDLGRLAAETGPYRLLRAHPIDFFPQTRHVETLAVLERR